MLSLHQSTPAPAQRPASPYCKTKGCGSRRAPGRSVCYRCRREAEKAANEVKYAYDTLRRNARRRGKQFEISLEDFAEFCAKTQYMAGKGVFRESLTIDRIDPTRGYVKGNLRAIPNGENVRKYLTFDRDQMTGQLCVFERRIENTPAQPEPTEDCPF